MRKLFVKNFPVTFGGEDPTGWLPASAAVPLPTPEQTISLDFAIEEMVGGGALLILAGTDNGIANDYWYNSVAAAIEAAAKRFDVPADLWREDETNGNLL